MPATEDLFGSLPTTENSQQSEATPAKVPSVGFLVTNHPNLMYILAAGLMMPPDGFGGKHYRDPLSTFPGWIPLFIHKIPAAAIQLATEEAPHLKPVVAEVQLGELSGTVQAVGTGGHREIHFPEQFVGTERVLLIPAPLPASRIKSIIFPSLDDRKAFEATSFDYGNVPVRDFQLGTRKTLFTKASGDPLPPGQITLERAAPLRVPLAAGGIMAMLLHFAHKGEFAVHACRLAFDQDDDPTSLSDDPILAELPSWMQSGAELAPPSLDIALDRERLQDIFQKNVLWGFVKRLSRRDRDTDGSAIDMLLNYLQNPPDSFDQRLKSGTGKLCETLHSLSGLAGATTSELFERHQTPLARAMILFCLHRGCSDLVRFSSEQLSETDWLAAAILFGVRDGWLGLPLDLRTISGLPRGALSNAVSHRMAQMAHRIAGTDLDLGPSPPRIRPLRELFGEEGEWRARERSAALKLSRALKWDCIQTRVSFSRGEYHFTVRGGSVHIDLQGEPRIDSRIDCDRFFKYLADTRLALQTESKIRASLLRRNLPT